MYIKPMWSSVLHQKCPLHARGRETGHVRITHGCLCCSCPSHQLRVNITQQVNVSSMYVNKMSQCCSLNFGQNKPVLCMKTHMNASPSPACFFLSFPITQRNGPSAFDQFHYVCSAVTSAALTFPQTWSRAGLGITRVLVWIWESEMAPVTRPDLLFHSDMHTGDDIHSHIHNCVWINYESWLTHLASFFCFSNYVNWVTYFALHLPSTVHVALVRLTLSLVLIVERWGILSTFRPKNYC